MTDEDGHRIEAAEQFGFMPTDPDAERYECTTAQLIAYAKACERKGLAQVIPIAKGELRNTGVLLSNPPQSSAAWDIRNAITKRIEAIDAELAPILIAEEERAMTAAGYVRGTDEPGKRWVKRDCEVCGGDCASASPPVMNCPKDSNHV